MDGGETWEPFVFAGDEGSTINRFQMFSDSMGFAAGRSIYKYAPATTSVQIVPVATRAPRLLLRSFPNPFSSSATIEYVLPAPAHVSVRIYTFLGRRIRTLDQGDRSTGVHAVEWDGKTDSGEAASSGIYLYRVDAGGRAASDRLLLMK